MVDSLDTMLLRFIVYVAEANSLSNGNLVILKHCDFYFATFY